MMTQKHIDNLFSTIRQKYIDILSCGLFKKKMEKLGLSDNNIEEQDIAIISIGDTTDYDTGNFYFNNGCNSHWFIEKHPNVLNINFDDCTPEDCSGYIAVPITEKQAKEIYDFILNNSNKTYFIVHCAAGISRSGAVGLFLKDYFEFQNFVVNLNTNGGIAPNPYVERLLHKIIMYD